MSENFQELKRLARKIDNDIEYLEETWRTASHILNGGGDRNNIEESTPAVNQFLKDLKEFREEITADEEIRKKFMANTEDDIKKMTNFYEQMKQDCEDVETLLSDWGYKPTFETSECSLADESEAESSILTLEQMNDIPSPRMNYDARNKTDLLFTPLININRPTSIATPVIKSLASEMKLAQKK